jgi:molecular chaperone DnaK (HSP70)
VLKNSGLKVDEIYAVELIGGGTRVPKLQVCIVFFVINLLVAQNLISYSSGETIIAFG